MDPFLFSTIQLPSSACTARRSLKLNRAVVLRLDDRLLEGLARRAADVERPHRELRSGFANGLRGDDADRFAELDDLAGRKVAAVALGANAAPAFAGEHRTNLELSTPTFSIAAAIGSSMSWFALTTFFFVDGIHHRLATDAPDDAGR